MLEKGWGDLLEPVKNLSIFKKGGLLGEIMKKKNPLIF